MMTVRNHIWLIIAGVIPLVAAVSGCSVKKEAVEARTPDGVCLVSADQLNRLARLADVDGAALPAELPVGRLAGDYYRGDGTGYNLRLSRHEDSTLRMDFGGCLGHSQRTSGRWHLAGPCFTFEARSHEEGGVPARALGPHYVLDSEGGLLLIPEHLMDHFAEHGVTRYACFRRTAQRAAGSPRRD